MKIQKPQFTKPQFKKDGLILIFNLVKKELKSFFSTPVAYIIIILFIIAVAFLLFNVARFIQFGTSDLSLMFSYIAFAFVVIIPAITMGSISKEKQSGTIEYVLTQPITELQFLISKFIAYSLLILVMLLTTLPLALMISNYGPLDMGQVFMQYIGAWVLGMALVSVGLAVSAFFKNEITSLLVTLILCVVFILLGSELFRITFGLDFILEKLGLLSHYQSISRGVLDIRDVLYFVAFIGSFFAITYFLIVKDKFPLWHKYIFNSVLSLGLTIFLALLLGVLGQFIPGRIDFTTNKVYTLSSTTQDIINKASTPINIDLYVSSNLPIESQPALRSVQDLLRDYSVYSAGKLTYQIKEPDKNEEYLTEAANLGIQPQQLGVSSANSSQVTLAYFALNIKYNDKNELIDLHQEFQTLTTEKRESNLEYALTKKIRKLTSESLKKVAFISNNVLIGRQDAYQILSAELSEMYDVVDFELKDDSTISADISAIILAAPSGDFGDNSIKKLKEYYEKGGSIFFLTNPIAIDENLQGKVSPNNLRSLFSDYGININEDLAYDLINSNTINVGSFIDSVKFPIWMTPSKTNAGSPILINLNSISVLAGSSISLDPVRFGESKVYELFKTTSSSNVLTGESINATYNQKLVSQSDDSEKLISVAIENQNAGRAVIVGDVKFLTPLYNGIIYQNDNLAFALASLEWLSKDVGISDVKAKDRIAAPLNLSDEEAATLMIVSVGLPIFVCTSAGILVFFFRKKKSAQVYKF